MPWDHPIILIAMGLAAICFLIGFFSQAPQMYRQYKLHRELRQKRRVWEKELELEMERDGT
jgi:uncharacterized integral membrane protein